ncbi:Predicted acyltransferase, LPLAT superfamily [Halopseudomonas sabulinigri]|uniref:Predicted acyltransferase, LPLAT superfamily n=1 Tax=Halopseudomonas sabulinigri TaxID=472181 RepID=A0A1H1T6Y4_9GAMM|nr:glycosyl transferase [Halopseudomonas sabulinigri]SDS55947.1 Predicted acyltransferase, LPLAT superfamily [Halopseudomonas sabulinigri]
MSEHWAQIGERGSLLGMQLLVWIQRHLGRWPFQLVLWPVMLWYFLSHGTARRASCDYWRRLEPALASRPLRLYWRSFAHFMSFGNTLMDKVAGWSAPVADERLCGDGVARFAQALESGQGGLVLVAHHGNLDIANAMAERHPRLDLLVLMHTRNAGKFNLLLEQVTGRPRPQILEVTEITPATAQMLDERIAAGGFVVIAADRPPVNGGRQRELDFLGAPATFPEGPFWLAALLRCPLYTLSCVRVGERFRIRFAAFDDTRQLPRKAREQWLAEAMQRYADILAGWVREQPLQWYNFFPFWLAEKHESDKHPH